MADSYRSITHVFMDRFLARLGLAGYSLNNAYNTMLYNLTNGTQVIHAESGFWFTYHFAVPAGGGLWWDVQNPPGGIWSDRVGVFYVAQPSGGSFTLSISTNGGPWVPARTLNGFSSAPIGQFTNVDLSLNYHRLRVDSQSGTNIILGAQLLSRNSAGVHMVFTDEPGISLQDVTNVPTSIRIPVFRAISPDLLIWHMKEEVSDATRVRLAECEQWWSNAAPACSVLYIGTPYASVDTNSTTTADQNAIVRSTALTYSRAYVDCMNPSTSYYFMLTNGFMADATHENLQGNQYLAAFAWDDMGFFALRTPRTLSIQSSQSQTTVKFSTSAGINYALESTSNLHQWQPVTNVGGNGSLFSTAISNSPPQFFRLRMRPGSN